MKRIAMGLLALAAMGNSMRALGDEPPSEPQIPAKMAEIRSKAKEIWEASQEYYRSTSKGTADSNLRPDRHAQLLTQLISKPGEDLLLATAHGNQQDHPGSVQGGTLFNEFNQLMNDVADMVMSRPEIRGYSPLKGPDRLTFSRERMALLWTETGDLAREDNTGAMRVMGLKTGKELRDLFYGVRRDLNLVNSVVKTIYGPSELDFRNIKDSLQAALTTGRVEAAEQRAILAEQRAQRAEQLALRAEGIAKALSGKPADDSTAAPGASPVGTLEPGALPAAASGPGVGASGPAAGLQVPAGLPGARAPSPGAPATGTVPAAAQLPQGLATRAAPPPAPLSGAAASAPAAPAAAGGAPPPAALGGSGAVVGVKSGCSAETADERIARLKDKKRRRSESRITKREGIEGKCREDAQRLQERYDTAMAAVPVLPGLVRENTTVGRRAKAELDRDKRSLEAQCKLRLIDLAKQDRKAEQEPDVESAIRDELKNKMIARIEQLRKLSPGEKAALARKHNPGLGSRLAAHDPIVDQAIAGHVDAYFNAYWPVAEGKPVGKYIDNLTLCAPHVHLGGAPGTTTRETDKCVGGYLTEHFNLLAAPQVAAAAPSPQQNAGEAFLEGLRKAVQEAVPAQGEQPAAPAPSGGPAGAPAPRSGAAPQGGESAIQRQFRESAESGRRQQEEARQLPQRMDQCLAGDITTQDCRQTVDTFCAFMGSDARCASARQKLGTR